MESYLRPIEHIIEDIENRTKRLEDNEKLVIEIKKDCIDNTYIYSQKKTKETTNIGCGKDTIYFNNKSKRIMYKCGECPFGEIYLCKECSEKIVIK